MASGARRFAGAAELANSADDADMRALAEEEIQDLRERVPSLKCGQIVAIAEG